MEAGRRKVLGDEHPDTLKVQSDIASLYSLQKRLDEAERLARKTLELQTRVHRRRSSGYANLTK